MLIIPALNQGIQKDSCRAYRRSYTDRAWRAEWDAIPQDKIRAMVARMAAINTLIIEFEGDNCFHG